METPNNKEISAIAIAANDAAIAKAKELGFDGIWAAAGIEMAWNAHKKTLQMFLLLGGGLFERLGEALEKAELHDVIKEAEEALEKEE